MSPLSLQVRKLFAKPEYLAELYNIDLEIVVGIIDCWIALKTEDIDALAFKEFGYHLCDRYDELYPWAEMCQSVHKVLRHGWLMMEACPETLSLCIYSEDGMEASNKYLKTFAVSRSRQMTRKNRLQDTHQRMLDMSDPILLSKRAKKMNKRKLELTPGVINLLKK